MVIRRTAVCRNTVRRPGEKEPADCGGGGWWGDAIPAACPKCRGPLTDLAVTYVQAVR